MAGSLKNAEECDPESNYPIQRANIVLLNCWVGRTVWCFDMFVCHVDAGLVKLMTNKLDTIEAQIQFLCTKCYVLFMALLKYSVYILYKVSSSSP